MDCIKTDNSSSIINSYKSGETFFEVLKNIPAQDNRNNTSIADKACDLDALKMQFFKITERCKATYDDDWKCALEADLCCDMNTGQYYITTTLLHRNTLNQLRYFHFTDDLSTLLSCGNLISYCRESETHTVSDHFPEELRWYLADYKGQSMVIDEVNMRLVIVPPPNEYIFGACMDALEGEQWHDWSVHFDLPMLYNYHLKARNYGKIDVVNDDGGDRLF
ncbi:MAG: hypothetical protein AAFW75_30550 [Cyanobacteria bacterium J06636_16]